MDYYFISVCLILVINNEISLYQHVITNMFSILIAICTSICTLHLVYMYTYLIYTSLLLWLPFCQGGCGPCPVFKSNRYVVVLMQHMYMYMHTM